MKKYASADDYFGAQNKWQSGLHALRSLLTESVLDETLKWGAPTYTLNGKNVVGVAAFKDYFGLWFHQGVFLSDPDKLLINAQEGKTKGLRQIRFYKLEDLDIEVIKKYVNEAIENEHKNKRITSERKKSAELDPVMLKAFESDTALKDDYDKFTPGKQREFAEYITSAKREDTKLSRMEKIAPLLKAGVGLNDKYRK